MNALDKPNGRLILLRCFQEELKKRPGPPPDTWDDHLIVGRLLAPRVHAKASLTSWTRIERGFEFQGHHWHLTAEVILIGPKAWLMRDPNMQEVSK
ncbi:MAG TPA: hypothetical protein VFF76_09690 [Holophagaceae bacterium]|jgi:hypothetical protein|nr:hypothetical protein [Holophagaceae bacterium]